MDTPKIGLCGSTLMNSGIVELIETAARHGFPTITVIPARVTDALEQGLTEKDLRRRLKDAGVQVTQIDSLTATLPGAAPLDISNAKLRAIYPLDCFYPPSEETCLRVAEMLEAPYLNITHFGGKPVPLDEIAEAIGAQCRRAAARGLQISLEFVPRTGIPDIASAEFMVKNCGERNFRLMIDPWHLDWSGGSVEDVAHLPPNSIAVVQLCDRVRQPPGATHTAMGGRSLPGEGEMPLFALARAVLANSPDSSFAIEWLSEETREKSPDQVAARVAAATKIWQAAFSAQT